MEDPKVFIFSGPGGAGKTTILNQLFKKKHVEEAFIKGISITTRKKRFQEVEGKDYFFVAEDEFSRLKKNDFFLESQKILDDYYGTPKLFYKLAKKKCKGLILCLDVKGGMCLKKDFKKDKIITLFIGAPTEKELYKRMKKRLETKGLIQRRVKLAKIEMQASKRYKYLIINKNVKSTLKEVEKILFK